MKYGILKSSTNTGADSELSSVFAAPLSIVSNQPAFVSDTASLRRVVSTQGVQRWEIEAALVPTNDSANYLAHSVLNGYNQVIYVRMPQVYRPARLMLNEIYSLRLTANAAVGSTTISMDGMGADQIPLGEFINIGNDPKVYVVTNSGINGVGVQIHPPLLSAKVINDTVKFGTKVTMRARYDLNTQLGIAFTDGILADPGSVKLIEAI